MTDSKVQNDDLVLVTGANGFIGVNVVKILLGSGFRNIRCFVRSSNRCDRLNEVLKQHGAKAGVDMVVGDLQSRDDCNRAAKDVAVIYHLAAGFNKAFDEAFKNSALATQNLLEAFAAHGRPRRFVNVSSFAVYSNLSLPWGAVLDETSPLEDSPQERFDAYAFGKLKQEEIVREYGRTHGIPFVVLRPGTVFGPGKRDLTGRIGIWLPGFFLHVGGSNQLPLTYVDNCAEAIVLAGIRPGVEGETFNVVDDELMTSRQFLRAYRRRVGRFFCLPLPYWLAYTLCTVCELLFRRIKRLPRGFNRRRCAAEWKGNRFPNRKLREQLGWKPRVSMPEAMDSFLAQFNSKAV
jgi:nucleoside-diphosphate-sugar epimerase